MDRGDWQATVHGGAKSWTQLSARTHTHTHRMALSDQMLTKAKKDVCRDRKREYREAKTIFHAKRDRQTCRIRTELSLFILSSYSLWVLTMLSSWFQSFLKSRWTLSSHTLGATPTSFPQRSSLAEADQKHISVQFSSVAQSYPTLWDPMGCNTPAVSPGVCSNSCTSSQWCHPTISSSVIPLSSCLQSFPASGSFPISQFFKSGSQSIGASALASVLPMNIQDWFPLGLTALISLQSKGLCYFNQRVLLRHRPNCLGSTLLTLLGAQIRQGQCPHQPHHTSP